MSIAANLFDRISGSHIDYFDNKDSQVDRILENKQKPEPDNEEKEAENVELVDSEKTECKKKDTKKNESEENFVARKTSNEIPQRDRIQSLINEARK